MDFFFPIVMVCNLAGPLTEGNPAFNNGCAYFLGPQTPLNYEQCMQVVDEMVSQAHNPPIGITSDPIVKDAKCVPMGNIT